ncbi:hypothetical protein J2Z21_009761 [Streptomyces griseochromogenes]|uniref:Uncharacterized protein n=1 Tax=Streptomyces griseochromogenes TaxID=68214 RepID=A0A1B1AZY5_9ACTN|nr:hypothetical protein [Streptomyces griseochromogenes]ANP52081.1 hypothetical protein AVL59_23175 [Streptomyces griseochromogenes]MBP2056742.1 hypothetical protein [Streptomyces griseochromogenes]
MGVVGEPHPSYAPFGRHPLLTTSVIVLLAAGAAYWTLAIFLFPSPFTACASCGLVAVLTGGLAFLGLRNTPRAIGTASAQPSTHAVRRHFGRSLLRGLRTGLLAGLALGFVFGIADTAALSVRTILRQDLPHGTLHRLADGTRYVITPDGWLHGLRPNGDRYVRTPNPVDGAVAQFPDGRRQPFDAPSADYARRFCQRWVHTLTECTPFHGHIEFHLRLRLLRFFDPRRTQTIHDHLEARLPNGAYTESYGAGLPDREAEWLTTLPPLALLGRTLGLSLTIGLALGLVSGLTAGLHTWLVSPADTARAVSPLASLRTDRATVITRGITLMTSAILVLSLYSVSAYQPEERTAASDYLPISLAAWLLVSPFAIFLSAWGWFLTTQLWLCTAGRLPWRLMAFLEEAHQRGVLRQTGAAYEFRHARLQEQLATPTTHAQPPSA